MSKVIDTRSPLSMSGFTARYWRVTSTKSRTLRIMFVIPRVLVLLVAWIPLLVWNFCAWVLFFWITLAWRAYRRGHRRDKRDAQFQQALLNQKKV